MPFDDIQQQTDSMSALASMPQEGAPMQPGGPPMGGPEQGVEGMGGPGIDTPQEKQAVELLMQGAQVFRQAAQIDPTVAHIIDKFLQDGFLQISEHYGFGEEGKLALKQAQMMKGRAKAQAVNTPGPTQGPPIGGMPSPPPMA